MSFIDLRTLTMHRHAEMEGRINNFDQKCDRAISDIKKMKIQARSFLGQLNCEPTELKIKFLNLMKKLDEYTYLITDINLALGQIEDISSDQTPVLDKLLQPSPAPFMLSPTNLMDSLSDPAPSTSTMDPFTLQTHTPPEKDAWVKVPKQDQMIIFSSEENILKSGSETACKEAQNSLPDRMAAMELAEAPRPPSPELHLPMQSLLQTEREYRGVITALSGASFYLITHDFLEYADFLDKTKLIVEKNNTPLTMEQARSLTYCIYYDEESDFYYRAMIVKEDQEDPGKLHVFLVDVGEQKAAPAQVLRPLPRDLTDRPPFARLCHLAAIDNDVYHDNEMLTKFESFMTNYINEPCSFVVDEIYSESTGVFVISNGKLINDVLVERGLAVPIDKEPEKEDLNILPHPSANSTFTTQTAPEVRYSPQGPAEVKHSPQVQAEVTHSPQMQRELVRYSPQLHAEVIHSPQMYRELVRYSPHTSSEVFRYSPKTATEVFRQNSHSEPPRHFSDSAEVRRCSSNSTVARQADTTSDSPQSTRGSSHLPRSLYSSVVYTPPEMVDSELDVDAPEYDDPVEAVTGYHNRDEEDICKHYRGGPLKHCFKGPRCTKKHILKHIDGWTMDRVPVSGKLPTLPLPAPRAWLHVQVTSVTHYDRLYVHLLNHNTSKEELPEYGVILPPKTLESLVRDMNSAAAINNYRPLALVPAPGELVVALYRQDNMWYRACVVTATRHDQSVQAQYTLQVQYVDYGTTAWVKENEVRVLEPRYCVLPAQAVRCVLAGVRVNAKDSEAWGRAKRAVDKALINRVLQAHVIARDFDEITVDLVDKDGYSMSQQLAAQGVFDLEEYSVCDDSQVTQKVTVP